MKNVTVVTKRRHVDLYHDVRREEVGEEFSLPQNLADQRADADLVDIVGPAKKSATPSEDKSATPSEDKSATPSEDKTATPDIEPEGVEEEAGEDADVEEEAGEDADVEGVDLPGTLVESENVPSIEDRRAELIEKTTSELETIARKAEIDVDELEGSGARGNVVKVDLVDAILGATAEVA